MMIRTEIVFMTLDSSTLELEYLTPVKSQASRFGKFSLRALPA